MTDFAIPLLVAGIFALITAAVASKFGRAMSPFVWLAYAEYSICAIIQYFFGLDASTYRENGIALTRLLELQFGWMANEVWKLLIQQPSALDQLVSGAGSNTGSMTAAAIWFAFIVRSSEPAVQALVAGLSMCSAFAVFDVLRDECPDISPQRLFGATVLFPSIAFWIASFHKESFCLMGMALTLCAWRAARKRRIRAIFYGSIGMTLLALFRMPALPPLLLGLVLHYIVDRVHKVRGVEITLFGPFYLGIGIAVIAVGMILIGQVAPSLAIDRLGDSLADHQKAWSTVEGGSSFEMEEPTERSLAAQLVMAPLGLLNGLFRPQLFDVRNPLMLISALEMTYITVLLVQALRLHGPRGVYQRMQSSPIVMMCTVVTIVGLTFVGLATRNFGSMARYRAPFLPFYGCLLAILTPSRAAPSEKSSIAFKRRGFAAPRTNLRRSEQGEQTVPTIVRTR